MKYLTNKKLWAAIIGLITAFGTLMVTLDEVKAYPVTADYNIVSNYTHN
jgi:hypothetical protein